MSYSFALQAFPVRRNKAVGDVLVRNNGQRVTMTRAGFSTTSFSESRSGGLTHNAVDISAPEGWWVVASTDGVIPENVVVRRRNARTGAQEVIHKKGVDFGEQAAGWFVYVDDALGNRHLNAHMKADSIVVRPGQRVVAGQILGQVGKTGDANAPHNHYAVHANRGAGAAIDPTRELVRLRPVGVDPGITLPGSGSTSLWLGVGAAALGSLVLWLGVRRWRRMTRNRSQLYLR